LELLVHNILCNITQQLIKNKLTHRVILTITKVKIQQKQFFSSKTV